LNGVPWWLSRLRILHCYCCALSHGCVAGSVPGSGNYTCHRHGQKEKYDKMNFIKIKYFFSLKNTVKKKKKENKLEENIHNAYI